MSPPLDIGTMDVGPLVAAIARKKAAEPPHRRTLSPVRRNSRPRGETRRVMLTWKEANERILALRKWERKQVKAERTRNRAVGHIGIAAYEFLIRRAVNHKGRLDDLSYEAIAAIIGYSRSAVVAAVARLRRWGWLDWVRQYEATGEPGVRGPQVRQTYNAFWIMAPLQALLKMGIRFGGAPPPDDHDVQSKAGQATNKEAEFTESPLGEAVARLGRAIELRETS